MSHAVSSSLAGAAVAVLYFAILAAAVRDLVATRPLLRQFGFLALRLSLVAVTFALLARQSATAPLFALAGFVAVRSLAARMGRTP